MENNNDWKIISENYNLLEKKIKEIKLIKDYGIYSIKINETTIYPEKANMKQEIWVNKKEKIIIEYINNNKNFIIIINFSEEMLLLAIDILNQYYNELNNRNLNDKNKIESYLENSKIEILDFISLSNILKKEYLKLEEILNEKKYVAINEGVYININNIIEIIKKTKIIKKITIIIDKKTEEENIWEYISSLKFNFESKYYEDGYLENIEIERIKKINK